jgi:putative IMPACT (imprinted ancient) family translation regulator
MIKVGLVFLILFIGTNSFAKDFNYNFFWGKEDVGQFPRKEKGVIVFANIDYRFPADLVKSQEILAISGQYGNRVELSYGGYLVDIKMRNKNEKKVTPIVETYKYFSFYDNKELKGKPVIEATKSAILENGKVLCSYKFDEYDSNVYSTDYTEVKLSYVQRINCRKKMFFYLGYLEPRGFNKRFYDEREPSPERFMPSWGWIEYDDYNEKTGEFSVEFEGKKLYGKFDPTYVMAQVPRVEDYAKVAWDYLQNKMKKNNKLFEIFKKYETCIKERSSDKNISNCQVDGASGVIAKRLLENKPCWEVYFNSDHGKYMVSRDYEPNNPEEREIYQGSRIIPALLDYLEKSIDPKYFFAPLKRLDEAAFDSVGFYYEKNGLVAGVEVEDDFVRPVFPQVNIMSCYKLGKSREELLKEADVLNKKLDNEKK